MGLATLAPFFPDRRAASPEAERINVILDNWPVHGHPDVLVALEPQTTRWAFSRPGNGPATPSGRAVRRAGDVRQPIQLMPLPTYASWHRLIASSWGGGCVRRSPACTAGRRIAIRCAVTWMLSSRRLQPAHQSFYSMSVSDSGLFIQRLLARTISQASDGHDSPAGASTCSGRASARTISQAGDGHDSPAGASTCSGRASARTISAGSRRLVQHPSACSASPRASDRLMRRRGGTEMGK